MASPTPKGWKAAWPGLLALAAVALAVTANLVVDVEIARSVARRTAEIVENSARSIELIDDLRGLADHMLTLVRNTPEATAERAAVAARMDRDIADFAPLATSRGEAEEYQKLQAHLRRLRAGDDAVAQDIDRSFDRLVSINQNAARFQAEAIGALHRRALAADATVGAITLLLIVLVGALLVGALARERRLAVEQLRLLDERNRELDAFAGRAAHDLRGPLSPIRGYADLLMSGGEPPEEIREMARRIRAGVDRMSRVVDDMLELSRAGRPQAGTAWPRSVADEVLEELAVELKGAALSVELPDIEVACAPGVLAQILRNLVGNAVKFRSRQRSLTLQLRGRADGEDVELTLADNGVGMEEEAAAHAFEPYYRGRQDREVPGHGLGLAIVERAVRAVGGRCSLTSAMDGGTTVTVVLPRRRA